MRQPTSASTDEVLDVFDRLENPREPLTAAEIEAALEIDGDAVGDTLALLASRDCLETKRLEGGDRVWWRSSQAPSDGETRTDGPAMRTVAERVLEVSPVGILAIDPSGTISFANERSADILGVTRERLLGRSYERPDWRMFDDDGTPIPAEEHPITRALRTGEPTFGFEHWIERSDGTKQWLSSNTVPAQDEDGTVEYVVTGFVDATALKRREEKLTSDHVRLLELRADRSAIPPSLRDASDEEIRLDVASIVPLPGGTTAQYMSTADVPANDFVTAISELPHIADVRLLSIRDGRTRIEVLAESTTVSEVFQSLGGRARAVIVGVDEARFLGEVPGDVELQPVLEGIRRFHSGVELVSQELVYSPRTLERVVTTALTDRQFAALETAYYGGYFDSPRASTGDELASHFDVTRQTFNQHLRKAERVVFQHLFEKSGEDAR